MGGGNGPRAKVVIIQGSETDNTHGVQLARQLRAAGFKAARRHISSAHRTAIELQGILDKYEERVRNGEEVIMITVAGKSDALSGTVRTRGFPTVVSRPDAKTEPRAAKKYSSTELPGGLTVEYAVDVPDAVAKTVRLADGYNTSQVVANFNAAKAKQAAVRRAEEALQEAQDAFPELELWKQGKVRDVYIDGEELVLRTRRDISAYEAKSPTPIPDKDISLNGLSVWWFKQTADVVPNHFIRAEGPTAMRVKRTDRINVEWIVRNHMYGSMWRAYQEGKTTFGGLRLPKYGSEKALRYGDKLPRPIVTPTTKEERPGYHDMPITRSRAVRRKLCTPEEWDTCVAYTLKLYEFYARKAEEIGLIIPDFKVEFGKLPDGTIIQIDEPPTHDSARFWPKARWEEVQRKMEETHATEGPPMEEWCLDKEFLRQLLKETGFEIKGKATELPELHPIIVDQIRRRTQGAYEVFVNGRPLEGLGLLSVAETLERVRHAEEMTPAARPTSEQTSDDRAISSG